MRARLGILGIVLLLALDVILVFFAFRHVQETPPSPLPLPSPSRAGQLDQERPKGPEDPNEDRDRDDSAPQATHLSLAEDGSFIRAIAGSCKKGVAPEVEISANRGREFETTRVEGVTEVLQVSAVDRGNLSLVGTDVSCAPTLYATEDGGESWTTSKEGADSLWFATPDGSRALAVHAPGGLTETPCKPLAVSAVTTDTLRILCTSGQILGTADVGATWITLGSLPRATDVHFSSASQGYAVAQQRACSTAVLETVDGGFSWSRLNCLGNGAPRAITAAGDIIGVQVGRSLNVSTDSGVSWAVP